MSTTPAFLKLVKHRDDNSIKEIVSTHHFHYLPDEANLELEFEALKLKKIWGKSHSLYKLVENERQNYLSNKEYDPIAVLLAVRIKIEQTVYRQLSSEHQIEFLKTHKSNTKLDYCSEQGIEIPEVFYLLGIIYNDDLHWREQRDYETPLISKLNNPTIRQMIKELPSPADSSLVVTD